MSRRFLQIGILVLVMSLVGAACGDDDDAATPDTLPETTTTEATPDTLPETTTTEVTPDTLPETTTTAAPTTTEAPPAGLTCGDGVTVGLITDQTGPLAIYGAHIMRGVPIGFTYATGDDGADGVYTVENCDIKLVVKDDQSNPELSATAARELIEVDGADIIIGTVSSGVTATLQEIARENDVILIAAPAAATDLTGSTFNENTFRASRNNFQDGIAICEYLTKQYDTFVQIAPDYSFGYGGADAYRQSCTALGGEFLADDVFAPADTTDFTPYMEQFVDVPADALLVTWAGGGFVPLLQAATDLGVLDTMALGSPFVDNIVMPAFFGNAIGQTSVILYHYTAPQNAANDYLIENVAAMYDTFPDLFDADGMNAAIMVVEALKASGGDASSAALRDALEGLEFEGPKGTINIRPEDHVAIQDMYVVTLLNLDDVEFKYYEYVETLRPEPPCLLEGDFAARCGDLPTSLVEG